MLLGSPQNLPTAEFALAQRRDVIGVLAVEDLAEEKDI
jgi:hypothetical protein